MRPHGISYGASAVGLQSQTVTIVSVHFSNHNQKPTEIMGSYNEQLAIAGATPQGLRAVSKMNQESSAANVGRVLRPAIQPGVEAVTVGGVTSGAIATSGNQQLMPFVISFTAPSSGDAKWIVIGNPGNLVSAGAGIATADLADWGGTWTYEEFKEIARDGVSLFQLNYEVNNAAQFAQDFLYVSRAADGFKGSVPLTGLLTGATRSSDNITTVKTLNLGATQLLIDRFNGLAIKCAAGAQITLTGTYAGVTVRG
jgi:hypothetical protein